MGWILGSKEMGERDRNVEEHIRIVAKSTMGGGVDWGVVVGW